MQVQAENKGTLLGVAHICPLVLMGSELPVTDQERDPRVLVIHDAAEAVDNPACGVKTTQHVDNPATLKKAYFMLRIIKKGGDQKLPIL